MKRAVVFAPRRCAACGTALEEWPFPLETGAYIACPGTCGRLYQATDDGAERVLLDTLDAEVRPWAEALIAAVWHYRIKEILAG